MKIRYDTTSFDHVAFPTLASSGDLNVQWEDLAWAAITCGKKGPFYWTSHPWHSFAEALSKTWSIYAFLTAKSGRPVRSALYRTMDPTEKGAASYFLGMTLTKIAADQLLDTPWIFHISTASQVLSFKPGKARPDLLGCTASALDWIVLEAKGRSAGLCATTLTKAKEQSSMVTTVNGKVPRCRAGVQSYFSPDLRVKLEDPPSADDARPVQASVEQAFQAYYAIRIALRDVGVSKRIAGRHYLVMPDLGFGITIGLPKFVVSARSPRELIIAAREMPDTLRDADEFLKAGERRFRERIYRDGFYIALDDRWSDRKMALEPSERNSE